MCHACGSIAPSRLCPSCAASCAALPPIAIGAVVVRSAYAHEGAPRRLVHRLKYRELSAAADVLAEAMAPHVPEDARELTPLPRALLRRWRHGIDPADELATRLGRQLGLPVRRHLAAGLWWPRHAASGANRATPTLRLRRNAAPDHTVLVDDVCTTGATMAAAIAVMTRELGPSAVAGGVTATRAASSRAVLLSSRTGVAWYAERSRFGPNQERG